MNTIKPPGTPMQAPAKSTEAGVAKGAPGAKTTATQGHRGHGFQTYMSADGRPKEVFHPYRDMTKAAAPSSALLARGGIARPLTIASLPATPTKTNK